MSYIPYRIPGGYEETIMDGGVTLLGVIIVVGGFLFLTFFRK